MNTHVANGPPVVVTYGRNMDELERRRGQQCRTDHMGDVWNVAYAALFLAVFHENDN